MDIRIDKEPNTSNCSVEELTEQSVKITIEDKEEMFDFSGLSVGSYFITDCMVLPYSPIERVIIHEDQTIELRLFFSNWNLSDPPIYNREAILYKPIPTGQEFNLPVYKSEACNKVTDLCVEANYIMFPQYKRDNVYSGSPVTDSYPDYLKGEAGKQSIARLNAMYQQISITTQAAINAETVTTKDEIDAIIEAMKASFPTEAEILAQIQSS